MGVSCWNFLAAPKAVVIMETLTVFLLLKRCGGHMTTIVLASSFWAEMTSVVIRGGSLKSDGNPEELLLLAMGETENLPAHSSWLMGCVSLEMRGA